MTQTVLESDPHLAKKPGYEEFMISLEAAFNLPNIDPKLANWVDVISALYKMGSPKVVLKVADDTPQLAVALNPMKDGQRVTGTSIYHAPILLQGENNWDLAREGFGSYQLESWLGMPEGKEIELKAVDRVVEKAKMIHNMVGEYQSRR